MVIGHRDTLITPFQNTNFSPARMEVKPSKLPWPLFPFRNPGQKLRYGRTEFIVWSFRLFNTTFSLNLFHSQTFSLLTDVYLSQSGFRISPLSPPLIIRIEVRFSTKKSDQSIPVHPARFVPGCVFLSQAPPHPCPQSSLRLPAPEKAEVICE